MAYRHIIRVVAGGVLLVYGITLAGDIVLIARGVYHEPRADGFALAATSTASGGGVVLAQDTVNGEEIEVPLPRPWVIHRSAPTLSPRSLARRREGLGVYRPGGVVVDDEPQRAAPGDGAAHPRRGGPRPRDDLRGRRGRGVA